MTLVLKSALGSFLGPSGEKPTRKRSVIGLNRLTIETWLRKKQTRQAGAFGVPDSFLSGLGNPDFILHK